MLPEMLQSISDRLPLPDFLAFNNTCLSWLSAPSGRSEIFKFKKDKPWLMLYVVDDGSYKCYIYSVSHPTCCTFRLPDLKGATLVESKLGWFLAHRDNQLFFFNHFSQKKIKFAPPLNCLGSDQAFTFSGLPTCSNCVVYVVDKFKIMTYRTSTNDDTNKWHSQNINVEKLDVVQRTVMDAYSCCCFADCRWKTKVRFTLYCPTDGSLVGYDYGLESEGFRDKREFDDHVEVEVSKELKALHGDDWVERTGGRRTISTSSLGNVQYSVGIYAGTWDIEIDREK